MTGTVVVTAPATTTTASPGRTTPGGGNPPVSAAAAPSTAPGGSGNDLAFTGASGRELWFAFGGARRDHARAVSPPTVVPRATLIRPAPNRTQRVEARSASTARRSSR